jgi:hypothetical protein
MIEANQLRIGNYVTVNNEKHHPKLKGVPLQVTGMYLRTGIDNEPTYSLDLNHPNEEPNSYNETYSQFMKFVKPIPLTATILEQAGFIKGKPFENTGHVPYHDKEYKGFVIIDCLDGTFWLADYKPYDVKIEFVHWLQNVYYFLIGSELNIQL